MIEPRELIARLRSQDLRCRTGILLVPASSLGQESEVAVRLGIDHMSLARRLLETVPEGGQFVTVNLTSVFRLLDDIADNHKGRKCVLIYDIDVAAMRLASHERVELWDRLMRDFPYHRVPLVFAIPAHLDGIRVLQEEKIRKEWEESGRMAVWAF